MSIFNSFYNDCVSFHTNSVTILEIILKKPSVNKRRCEFIIKSCNNVYDQKFTASGLLKTVKNFILLSFSDFYMHVNALNLMKFDFDAQSKENLHQSTITLSSVSDLIYFEMIVLTSCQK